MKQLTLVNISEELYDTLLNSFPSQLEYCENIYPLFYGTSNKNKLYFNEEYIIIKQCKFNYIYKVLYGKSFFEEDPTNWKQIKLRVDKSIEKAESIVDGTHCYNYIMDILTSYYSKEEIEDILNTHVEEKNKNYEQYHYKYVITDNNIHKFPNCYKYDITKAHAAAIIALFPKSEKDIMHLLEISKKAKNSGDIAKSKKYKNYVNYFVGALCNHGHRLTYNYIVHNVTRKLFDTYNYTKGMLLYANTDSFTVYQPEKILNPSDKVGDFKLEYKGDIYIYKDDNYWLMQYGNEFVGSSKVITRKYCDFSKGQVVHYTNKRTFICEDDKGKKHYRNEVTDICTEKVNVVEH